jgi:hypothetical protein
MTWQLKAGIVEEEAAIARQRHGKHISTAMNKHETIEELLEAVFSMQSAPRLYNEDQWDCRSATMEPRVPVPLHQHEQHAGQSIGAPNVNSLPLDNSMLRIVPAAQQFMTEFNGAM